mmetsp:Transcript_40246/g.93600  ORF Transcript_40246/g.93600 Transcript_40246/m.93600 type:complete len:240 (+) Transcript_40246:1050-1769(+)
MALRIQTRMRQSLLAAPDVVTEAECFTPGRQGCGIQNIGAAATLTKAKELLPPLLHADVRVVHAHARKEEVPQPWHPPWQGGAKPSEDAVAAGLLLLEGSCADEARRQADLSVAHLKRPHEGVPVKRIDELTKRKNAAWPSQVVGTMKLFRELPLQRCKQHRSELLVLRFEELHVVLLQFIPSLAWPSCLASEAPVNQAQHVAERSHQHNQEQDTNEDRSKHHHTDEKQRQGDEPLHKA